MELWLLFALGSALCAGLTTILAKVGVRDVGSNLATAIRTMVVVVFTWIIVLATGSQQGIGDVDLVTWLLLIGSGLATGGAWLCRFKALKLGNVNKVTPIAKTSTLLTMILAFIFLGEPLGAFTIIAMVMMGAGTWLMLELKKSSGKPGKKEGRGWLVAAVLAAFFASMVAILGSVGVAEMNANLWTATRTMVVALVSWFMVGLTREHKGMTKIKPKTWVFLVLSGLATGGSWIFFYHALKIGPASIVVPVDQLSILLTMAFARLFLKERFSKQSLIGLGLLTGGILLLGLQGTIG